MSIIVFIIILTVIVLIHEFGHFIMAKKNGVKVEEFGIGFPPRLFGVRKGETLYSVNALPIGGFVKLYGEEYHEKPQKELQQRAFVYKKPWQKALIIVGGVIGNFLLGWVLISFLFTQGVPTPVDKVIVDGVGNQSPAMQVGIKKQDEIYGLVANGKTYTISSSNDLIDYSKKFLGQPVTLLALRGNDKMRFTLTPRKNPPKGQGPLGIVITSFIEKKYTWYQAPFFGLIESFKITKTITVQLVQTIVQVATLHKPQADIAGPIGIAQYTGQAIKFGKNAVLEFVALLSLNLAIVNILPFPALDGGRFVFVLYEWITKKRVNQTVEQYLNLAGIIILLSLFVLVSFHDVVRIVTSH